MYEIMVETKFAAAHKLQNYSGNCQNLHGHNWIVQVFVRGNSLSEIGLLMDFRDLKKIVNDIIDQLDHTYLNEHIAFNKQNPSSENLAHYIFETLAKQIDTEGLFLYKVSVWETPKVCASYSTHF